MSNDPTKLRYRLNNWTTCVICMVLFLTPFALGGNRPFAWTLSFTTLSLWCGLYFALMGTFRIDFHFRWKTFQTPTLLFTLLLLYTGLQILPFSGSGRVAVENVQLAITQYGVFSLTPGDTALSLMRWISYGMLFFLTTQICANDNRRGLFVKALFALIAFHALYGILLLYQFGDTILFMKKWAYQGSATGGFVNRNSFATFLAFGAVLGTALVCDAFGTQPVTAGRRKALERLMLQGSGTMLMLAGYLAILTALILTTSRMGIVAAFCGMFTVLLIYVLKNKVLSWKVVAASIAALLAGFSLLILLYGGRLVERVLLLEQASSDRMHIYRQVMSMIADRPLSGFGGDSFEYVFPIYHQAPVLSDIVWDKAHSTYLALWVEYGLVFGSLPLAIIGWCFFRLLTSVSRGQPTSLPAVAALGAIVVSAIHSTVDFSLEIQGVNYVFVVLLAAGIAAISSRKPLIL